MALTAIEKSFWKVILKSLLCKNALPRLSVGTLFPTAAAELHNPAIILQWCLWSFCRYMSPLHVLLLLSMVLWPPFSSAVLFPLLHQRVEKVNRFNFFSLKSCLKLQSLLLGKPVFQFSVVRMAAIREPPTTPHLCRRQDLFQYCPGWICTLEWRPLSKGRLGNPQDAAHSFAEVAAHFWKRYSLLLSLSWWICLSNRSWNLVDAVGTSFSCYLETGEKYSPFFF